MNWFARNLVVMLVGTTTSVAVAVFFIYLEARTGESLFAVSLLKHIPLGAIVAGTLGALGYLGASLALRLRPAVANLLAVVGIAAAVIFLVQSAEFEFFLGGETQTAAATKDSAAFARFLGSSMLHSPLEFWGGADDSDGAASAMFFSGATAGGGPHVASTGDSKADGIGEGVSGMMATQDASNSSAAQHLTQLDAGIENVGAKVKSHGGMWTLMALQVAGFALGGLAAFAYVRSMPHCRRCMLLLNRKGEKTRYFSRSRDMRSSVDEVLVKARDRQLQQSIHMHTTRGSEKRQTWSEYCSTLEIRRCMQCNTHQMDFHARRKDGATWKDIALLGFSSTTLEPLDFA